MSNRQLRSAKSQQVEWKCRTGKWRTKCQGLKMQNWKITDWISGTGKWRTTYNERRRKSFRGYLSTEKNNPTVWKTKRTAACNSRHKPSRPSYATADFEEAPVSALQQVFETMSSIAVCWFHYAQAVFKRLTKICLKTWRKSYEMSAQTTGVASWWNYAGRQWHSPTQRLLMTANTWRWQSANAKVAIAICNV